MTNYTVTYKASLAIDATSTQDAANQASAILQTINSPNYGFEITQTALTPIPAIPPVGQ